MSGTNESRPLAELLGGLASDISTLFRKEVQLAKAEASEKVSQTMGGVSAIAIGGIFVLGALGVFLSAVVSLLAAFLVSQGVDPTLASALAAFAVTAVVGVAGWMTIAKGMNALKAGNLNLNRTAASLGRDADIMKERL
jgi:hypothetical protein